MSASIFFVLSFVGSSTSASKTNDVASDRQALLSVRSVHRSACSDASTKAMSTSGGHR